MNRIPTSLFVLGAGLSALFAGCQQNPFPTDGQVVDRQPVVTVVKNYTLDVPAVMEFTECENAEYTFRAVVPNPASPIVTVTNLPDGATFDPDGLRLTWAPPTLSSGSPDGATESQQAYQVNIALQSSDDPATVIQRTAVLLVKNNSKRFFTFNRLSWQQGIVLTVGVGQTKTVSVPLAYHSFPHVPVLVTVSPAAMESEVSYDVKQGAITVSPKLVGTRMFSLTGLGKGETEIEYFTIDVPPPPSQ